MSNFVLKIIAMITMLCDHLGYAIFGKFSSFNYIGRIAFPIFAFGISEGYHHTKSKKNYAMRLLMFAIVSQAPFMWFSSMFRTDFSLNIFFTLLIGLIAIIGYESCKNKYVGMLLVVSLCLTADFLKTDYGYFGVLMIFIFHIFRDKKWLMYLSYIALCLVKYVPLYLLSNFNYAYILLCLWTIVPLLFIHLYNGKKGPNTKYLLYGFYPVHLIILYTIRTIFFI